MQKREETTQPNSNHNHNKRDSRVDSGSLDLETPLSEGIKSPLDELDAALKQVVNKPTPPPRKAPASTPKKNIKDKDNDTVAGTFPGAGVGQLPDKHRSLHMPLEQKEDLQPRLRRPHLAMSDEVHDYSEIYTPTAGEENKLGVAWTEIESCSVSADSGSARTGSGDSGLTSSEDRRHPNPPPPPLHRYPSWEDRIYQVACEAGLPNQQQVRIRQDDVNTCSSSNRNSLCGYGDDISVPVYASVKGVRSSICQLLLNLLTL